MTQKIWPIFILIVFLCVLVACVPTEAEPGVMEFNQTPTPYPISIAPDMLPLHPEAVPAALPVYAMALDPSPTNGETALAWAQSFGLANAELMAETSEMVLVISRGEAAGSYEQLSFMRTPYEQLIVYSGGTDWQTVPAPVDGELVGFDPVTDILYFVGRGDGRLHIWPVTDLLP